MPKPARRILLINKPFQLRFSFYVCSWIIALSFVYPILISTIFDYFARYLALDPMGPTLTHLERVRTELLQLLFGSQVILVAITFLISIYMSHKIAGPLYRLRKYFQDLAAGRYQKLAFRNKDYFPELADEYNLMMESIRSKIEIKTHGIELAIPRIERALVNASPALKSDLEAALSILRQTQGK